MLTNNWVVSGIITASYYETSERHKGANEGGKGARGAVTRGESRGGGGLWKLSAVDFSECRGRRADR